MGACSLSRRRRCAGNALLAASRDRAGCHPWLARCVARRMGRHWRGRGQCIHLPRCRCCWPTAQPVCFWPRPSATQPTHNLALLAATLLRAHSVGLPASAQFGLLSGLALALAVIGAAIGPPPAHGLLRNGPAARRGAFRLVCRPPGQHALSAGPGCCGAAALCRCYRRRHPRPVARSPRAHLALSLLLRRWRLVGAVAVAIRAGRGLECHRLDVWPGLGGDGQRPDRGRHGASSPLRCC